MESDETKKKGERAQKEEEILKFWQEKKIFDKSLEKAAPNGDFVFYDGPPYATGLPHFGHMLPSTMKDVIPRFQTMRGKRVIRRWGWDCHGLPIENLIEKELDLKSKKEIEEYGIGKFNEKARASVLRYADEWKKIIPRIGRWADMEHDYRTMDSTYTESVWWSFKTLQEKGLVYEGYKVMPFCPHCETTLSNFEVNQGYQDTTDLSAYAKFELIDESGTFVVAWTTTPWTLPANTALAVSPDAQYIKIRMKDSSGKDELFIIAKNLLAKASEVTKSEFEIVEEFLGSDLVGKSYKPLFDYYKEAELEYKENIWKIWAGEFVTLEDGTGIVHIAPAFGDDDLKLSQQHHIPFIQHVSTDGSFKKEVADFAGMKAKPKDAGKSDHQSTDVEIIKNLAHRGLLFAKEKIIHPYAHCWRCNTPLLNYATSAWFVSVASQKEKLIDANKKINWVPKEIGENRFGEWLENARDWNVSRSRFWGAPLPVWKSKDGKRTKFIGSIKELADAIPSNGNSYFLMRHGEAESNVLDVINSGDKEKYGLTEQGKEQAMKTAELLKGKKIDLIISSDFRRTRETAEIVAKAIDLDAAQIIFEPALREADARSYDGKKLDEYRTHLGNLMQSTGPSDIETLAEVAKRSLECLYNIDEKYSGKNILIVSHGLPLYTLLFAEQGFTLRKALFEGSFDRFAPAEMRQIKFKRLPHNENYELDLHRPYIDQVEIFDEDGEKMTRVPEVFDVWYDSGSMPFAQIHYPFEHKEEFEARPSTLFPADFIAEGLDQTRGWFYVLLVMSVLLFGESSYKNVAVNGLILAEDGRKMSKSLRNYADPMETIDKFGADALRYFLISSPAVKAEEVAFSDKGLDDVNKKLFNRLMNVVSFYEMYAPLKSSEKSKDEQAIPTENVLDVWLLSRLEELRQAITENLEIFQFDKASRPIADFIDDLSTWYLRRSRDRFKGEDEVDRKVALETTHFVLITLSKLMAPFTPFIAEEIFQKLKAESDSESVHLEGWPEEISFKSDIDQSVVILQMKEVRKIVSFGLEARAKAGIKARQPLQELRVSNDSQGISDNEQLLSLIKDEVNVKEVVLGAEIENEVELDTEITAELRREGIARDFIREIQDQRKEQGFSPKSIITLEVSSSGDGIQSLKEFEGMVKKVINAITIDIVGMADETSIMHLFEIGGIAFRVRIVEQK
jgi:isoleucyl-tRNA synthetase